MRLPRRSLFAALLAVPVLAMAQPAAAARSGGTLTVISAAEPRSLVSLVDTKVEVRPISSKIVEGLLRFDDQFRPQPELATAWSVSADGLRYTFQLRRGVKWHDGRDFSAADVRFSLLTLKRHGPRGRSTFANLERIDTPDPYTAVVVLSKPAPYLLRALAAAESPIVPAHVYGDADPLTHPANSAPVGTGPFVFESWERGSHVVLRRNPAYWQPGKPLLDRVVLRFVVDTAAISAALETGEADVTAPGAVGLADVERLSRNPKLRVDGRFNAYVNSISLLEYNLDNPVLARREVRQAIAHALNRDFIKQAAYFGHTEISHSTIPPELPAYHDADAFRYAYDLGAANRLLDEAGFKRGPDGQRFALRIALMPTPPFRATAEYLRASLGRLGIKAELQDGDLGSWTKRIYTDRAFDLNVTGTGLLFDPTVGVHRIYRSDSIGKPVPFVNGAHYKNPEVDALFERAAVEVDEALRAQQFKQIQRIVGVDLPVYPLVKVPVITIRNERVHRLYDSIDPTSSSFTDTYVAAP